MVRHALETVYEQFVDRVEIGRGDRLPDVSEVAQGRLFVGATCIDNGMADRLGGLDLALNDIAQQLELAEGEYDVVNLPAALSLGEYLDGMFGLQSPATGVAAALTRPDAAGVLATVRQVLGPVAWRSLSRSLQGMMQLQHEPVLLMMPSAIVVR